MKHKKKPFLSEEQLGTQSKVKLIKEAEVVWESQFDEREPCFKCGELQPYDGYSCPIDDFECNCCGECRTECHERE